MKKFAFIPPVLILAFVLPLWAANQAPVIRLLPTSKDKGFAEWKPVSGSLQYAKGDGLTDIYNGGYEEYLRAGVVDAARNLYMRKSDVMELTVHTMKSDKAAKAFFIGETKSAGAKPYQIAGYGSMAIVTKDGQSRGYAYIGKYYVTAFGMYSGPKAEKDAKLFVQTVMTKAVPPRKAPKK
ncbi:MAG: hypothetical protein Q7N50_06765 [Armatimonadota bacterium]|nr:hypothetical protein [Armatimonadota bacterium]